MALRRRWRTWLMGARIRGVTICLPLPAAYSSVAVSDRRFAVSRVYAGGLLGPAVHLWAGPAR